SDRSLDVECTPRASAVDERALANSCRRAALAVRCTGAARQLDWRTQDRAANSRGRHSNRGFTPFASSSWALFS
ncbi:MAG TPA: hypothetical protein VFQ61_28900, partial [Polyangiaceae bacterium]|nr:hypothetical protein [Polyangiaceae bacterium]